MFHVEHFPRSQNTRLGLWRRIGVLSRIDDERHLAGGVDLNGEECSLKTSPIGLSEPNVPRGTFFSRSDPLALTKHSCHAWKGKSRHTPTGSSPVPLPGGPASSAGKGPAYKKRGRLTASPSSAPSFPSLRLPSPAATGSTASGVVLFSVIDRLSYSIITSVRPSNSTENSFASPSCITPELKFGCTLKSTDPSLRFSKPKSPGPSVPAPLTHLSSCGFHDHQPDIVVATPQNQRADVAPLQVKPAAHVDEVVLSEVNRRQRSPRARVVAPAIVDESLPVVVRAPLERQVDLHRIRPDCAAGDLLNRGHHRRVRAPDLCRSLE